MYKDQCLVCAWLCSGLAIRASMDCVTSQRQLGPPAPPRAVRICMHSETASKGSDVVRPAWDTRSTTPILPVSAVGDDDEDEDGARLESAHYAHAAADVPRTDMLSALMLHLRPPFCLLRVYLSQMAHGSSLDSGLAQSSASTRGSQWCI
jgi:hypothetical protein